MLCDMKPPFIPCLSFSQSVVFWSKYTELEDERGISMQRMVNKFGYKKTKWGMIALVTILSITLIATGIMAALVYHSYNVYTTITM